MHLSRRYTEILPLVEEEMSDATEEEKRKATEDIWGFFDSLYALFCSLEQRRLIEGASLKNNDTCIHCLDSRESRIEIIT